MTTPFFTPASRGRAYQCMKLRINRDILFQTWLPVDVSGHRPSDCGYGVSD